MMKKLSDGIFRLEHEVISQCGIAKEHFHKVSGSQWENMEKWSALGECQWLQS